MPHISGHQGQILDPSGGSNQGVAKMVAQIGVSGEQIGECRCDFLIRIDSAKSLQEADDAVSLTPAQKRM